MDINTCNTENTCCILINVNFTINVEDFLRAVVGEGEVMPLIVVDCGRSKEPARVQFSATDFDFPLVSTSTGTEHVQNIVPIGRKGDDHVIVCTTSTVRIAFSLDFYPCDTGEGFSCAV